MDKNGPIKLNIFGLRLTNGFKLYSKHRFIIIWIYTNGKKRRRSTQSRQIWQESQKKKSLNFLHLYLQSFKTSPSRHWYLKESNEHHELIHSWYFRSSCYWRFKACQIQQKKNSLISRSSISRQAYSSRRTRQARCFIRY